MTEAEFRTFYQDAAQDQRLWIETGKKGENPCDVFISKLKGLVSSNPTVLEKTRLELQVKQLERLREQGCRHRGRWVLDELYCKICGECLWGSLDDLQEERE